MSKKKAEIDATIITSNEEENSRPIVVKNATSKVTPKFTGVRFIAGTWYTFVKDNEVVVPTNVADILRNASAVYL